jgi:large subunit ribosomal protein L21
MYAIIRAGGKQAKVHSGDVIEIERVKGDAEELSFAPLLVVDDKGTAISDRTVLAKATVSAKVLGESAGPKIDIFKYKNKSGYRRRQGHRQKYTQIEITGIELPSTPKAKTSTAAEPKTATAAKPKTATTEAKATAKPKTATAAKPKTATTEAKTTAKPKTATAAKPKTTTAKPAAAKTTKPAKPKSSEEE